MHIACAKLWMAKLANACVKEAARGAPDDFCAESVETYLRQWINALAEAVENPDYGMLMHLG